MGVCVCGRGLKNLLLSQSIDLYTLFLTLLPLVHHPLLLLAKTFLFHKSFPSLLFFREHIHFLFFKSFCFFLLLLVPCCRLRWFISDFEWHVKVESRVVSYTGSMVVLCTVCSN